MNKFITASRDDVEQSEMKGKLRHLLLAIFNQARDLYEDALNARKLQEIVLGAFTPLNVSAEVSKLLSQPTFDKVDLYGAILNSLQALQNRLRGTPRNVSLLAGEVSREDRFADVDTPEIREALTDLARASMGMLHLADDGQVTVLGSLDELRRRVASISGGDSPPRRSGTFRKPQ